MRASKTGKDEKSLLHAPSKQDQIWLKFLSLRPKPPENGVFDHK